MAPITRLPITLLSGFLGSGKTTLLEHILRSKDHGLKCAVIVNDMAALNIDAQFIKNHQVVQKEEKVVQMQNGCICCTLREDLLEEVCDLAEKGEFDYLVIESTGISEPMQVAETFTSEFLEEVVNGEGYDPVENKTIARLIKNGGISRVAKLDTCVTVVDCLNFYSSFETAEFLSDRYEEVDETDERTITDLMVDQLEFANVVILNKIDLVSKETLRNIEGLVRKLNPEAKIIKTNYSKIDIREIINTGLFDFEKASTSFGWLKSLHETVIRNGKSVPKPETEEYGVTSFVYTQRRPFHNSRLLNKLTEKLFIIQEGRPAEDEEDHGDEENCEWEDDERAEVEEEEMDEEEEDGPNAEEVKERISRKKVCPTFGPLLRSKGFIWLASSAQQYAEWSQAGCVLTLSPGYQWFCEVPSDEWPTDPEVVASIKQDFDQSWPWGDRRQEIVMIGSHLNHDLLREALDSCLVNDEEWFKWQEIMGQKIPLEQRCKQLRELFAHEDDLHEIAH